MFPTRNLLPPHATLRLKVDGLSITAYKSGKVLSAGKGIEDFYPKEPPRTIDGCHCKKPQETPLFQKVLRLGASQWKR